MPRILLAVVLATAMLGSSLNAQTVSGTYTSGHIPTSYPDYDPTCTGPVTTLSIALPSTVGTYEITEIDIIYDMTATSLTGGATEDQRSQLYCQNTSMAELFTEGPSGGGGTVTYTRSADIANGKTPF